MKRNRLGQPRIEFEDLTDELARSLAFCVAAALRQRMPGLAPKEGHLSFSSAADALLEARDENKAVDVLTGQLVKILSQAGNLDEHLLESAAEEGDIAFLAHALGERAGISGAGAWDYLADGDNGRLVLLL